MSTRRVGTLVGGLVLVLAGALFLVANLTIIQVDWWHIFKLVFPLLFVVIGGLKLIRHYRWSYEEIEKRPLRAGLLSGLFWLALGVLIFLDILGAVETLGFFGVYWPVLLIGFGIGKIIDHFRFQGVSQVRMGEVFGLVFVIVLGLASHTLSKAHLPLLDEIGWGEFRFPFPIRLESEKFEFETTAQISLEGISLVRIENLYGDVSLRQGDGDRAAVRLVQTISADKKPEAEEFSKRVRVITAVKEGVLTIGSNRADLGEEGRRLRTTLAITLPAALEVEVENGFGHVSIVDRQASCSVTNSYGDVRVQSQSGGLTVRNRNGEVSLRSAKGPVKVENRRGTISLSNHEGPAELKTEHGSVRVEHVTGSVVVHNHFGSVRLVDIEGGATVAGDGTSVTVEGVTGPLSVRNSRERVLVRNAGGAIDLEASNNQVRIERAAGDVTLQAVHSEVLAEDLAAGIKVQGRESSIRLRRVTGRVEVATTLQGVHLENCLGPVSIENEFGEIVLDGRQSPVNPVTIKNRNGSIRLLLPGDADFMLVAQALGGEIDSEFGPEAASKEGNVSFLETKIGRGGPKIELTTTQSRIEIRKRG
jgi:hypothetical protein